MDSDGVGQATPSLAITNVNDGRTTALAGHNLPRETNECSLGVSLGPAECRLDPKGTDSLNPTVGFLQLQTNGEVKSACDYMYEPSVRW
jgi:hypothetical protein